MVTEQEGRRMTFYNHIESVRSIVIDLTNGRKWRGAIDKAAVFDDLDAARREYMRLSDENDKLREHITTQKKTIKSYRDKSREWREVAERWREVAEYVQTKNTKLRDENSRLKKYASKALSAFSYCDCCPYVDSGCDTETVPMHEGCKAFEELSELGVEVDM